MEVGEIKKMANLARIEITDKEAISLKGDILAILDYVKKIDNADIDSDLEGFKNKNIFREDIPTTNQGQYTDKILKEAPETKDGYFKVKKIL